MAKRFLRLIIIVVATVIITKCSTFGWRPGSKPFMNPKSSDRELVENLKRHVYKLSHDIGDRSLFKYEKLKEACDYLAGQFKSFGYDIEFQEYSLYGKVVKNIIAIKSGLKKSDEIIIAGAHYDSCDNPGADDNASAVAGLLELARLLSDSRVERTIKFIAFVNEEPPFFQTDGMGSRVYAQAAKKLKENIKEVLILEMIGYYSNEANSQRYPPLLGPFYPNKGNYIAVLGNFRSRRLIKKVLRSFKDNSDFPIESLATFNFFPGVDFSDHWSFWKEGYPAVMITDTSFYRYPHYHQDSDTYDKLNYENMAEVVQGLKGSLKSLAE